METAPTSTMTVTSAEVPRTLLHDFPAELLLSIFSAAAISSDPVYIACGSGDSRYFNNPPPERSSMRDLHLVCRRFHQLLSSHVKFKGNQIFYCNNVFRFTGTNSHSHLSFSNEIKAIQRVQFICSCIRMDFRSFARWFELFKCKNLRILKVVVELPGRIINMDIISDVNRNLDKLSRTCKIAMDMRAGVDLYRPFQYMQPEDLDVVPIWSGLDQSDNVLAKPMMESLKAFRNKLRRMIWPSTVKDSEKGGGIEEEGSGAGENEGSGDEGDGT